MKVPTTLLCVIILLPLSLALAACNNGGVQRAAIHNEWTWSGGANIGGQAGMYGTLSVGAAGNIPGARQSSVAWRDTSGNFWLFGGNGLDSAGSFLLLNDLWKYNSGQWTWMGGSNIGNQQGAYGSFGVPAMGNIPGARRDAVSWADSSGNLWLFGGNGNDSTGKNGPLNDLWKYSAGEWAWMGGSNIEGQSGIYGTEGVPSPNNTPGCRVQAASWVDASGNFWLFGGFGHDSTGANGPLNDLWKYSAGAWTWVSGSNLINQRGVYGTQGAPASGNVPGARYSSAGWTDAQGDLWLFGGFGLSGFLNDLWKYSNGQWTWMAGSAIPYQSGTYGTPGVPAGGNVPGARQTALSWTDSRGNFWLFGGNRISWRHGVAQRSVEIRER